MFGTNLPRTSNSPSEKLRFETSKSTTFLNDVDEVGLGRRCCCNIDWCCTYAWHSPTSFTTRSLRVVVRVQARARVQLKDFKLWYQDVWAISWPPAKSQILYDHILCIFLKLPYLLRFCLMLSCRFYLKTIGVLEVIDWFARCSRHLPWGIDGSQLFVFGRSLGGARLLRVISSLSTKTGKPCKQVWINRVEGEPSS